MTSPKSYDGSCFCGAVQFTVAGEPVSMGYCHCKSCRHWSAAHVNAFTLWQPENVRITRRRKYWDLQQNAAKLSQVVQDMRRPHFYRASWARIDGRLCCGHSWCPVHSGAARELQRNQIAHSGWFAQ